MMGAPWPGTGGLFSSKANSTSTAFRPAILCIVAMLGLESQKPFRRQLRWLMRVTFFGCKKSNQKCALQAAAVQGAGRNERGLGVWHGALVLDLLVRAECSSLAPRRRGNSSFYHYRSGAVLIVLARVGWG